jgi:hypothetical protein
MSEIKVDILRPFGPRILKANVPQKIVDDLNQHCDERTVEEHDASTDLVGHVQEELKCDINQIKSLGSLLYNLTFALYEQYMNERNEKITSRPDRIAIHNSWFVRSFANDYNPVHLHTNSSFSCVLYLKVPEGIKEVNTKNAKKKYATEGYIDFIHGGSGLVCPANLCAQPKVGDLYIFPAELFHTVYPFYGDGERRSFSANMSLDMKGKDG